MNQFVATLRHVLAVLAAVSLLSGLSPARARAQSDTPPSTPAAADTKPAVAPKPAKEKKAKAPVKSFEERKKEDGVYAGGSNWLSARFGWAKRTGELAGHGFVGYGLGYQHMISRKYAFAAGVGHDVVGHFGHQIDEAFPFSAEFQRHYNWKSTMKPFVGLGGGYYMRKQYRTGTEYTTLITGGPHVTIGFTSALDEKHVIGLEMRVAKLQGRTGIVNPTFGPGESSETIWTVKGTWALVY